MPTGPLLQNELEDMLPHGSGIDGKWWFQQDDAGGWLCQNTYSVMNDVGMYIGDISFSFYLEWDADKEKYDMGPIILDRTDVSNLIAEYGELEDVDPDDEDSAYHGWGDEDADFLVDYLGDTIHYSLEDHLKSFRSSRNATRSTTKNATKNAKLGTVVSSYELSADDGYQFFWDSSEIADVEDYLGDFLADQGWNAGDMTAVIVKVGNGDYDEVWASSDSRPYETGTSFELVFTQEAFHKWITDSSEGKSFKAGSMPKEDVKFQKEIDKVVAEIRKKSEPYTEDDVKEISSALLELAKLPDYLAYEFYGQYNVDRYTIHEAILNNSYNLELLLGGDGIRQESVDNLFSDTVDNLVFFRGLVENPSPI